MTILRVYRTDIYRGIEDHGTVDFIFDEDDEYAGLDDFDSEPYQKDVLREDTKYDHVDHNLEIVTLSEMRKMKEELEEEISELEEKRNTVEDALDRVDDSRGPNDYDNPSCAAEGIGR